MIVDILPYRQYVLDFIEVTPLKNGTHKITFPAEKAVNVYAYLKKLGFARVLVDKKFYYIQRSAQGIQHVGFMGIEHAFRASLEKSQCADFPEDINRHDVLNAYFERHILKENSLLKAHLAEVLNAEDMHALLLLVDYKYKKDFEVSQLLEKLNVLQFKQVSDKIGTYHRKEEILFFKHVGGKRYLVFNFMDHPEIKLRMFDCWLSAFENKKRIGSKIPTKNDEIRLGFNLERDFDLLKPYLN